MGFTVKQMVELVRAGLARAKAERVVAGRKSIEVARVRIAEAGGGLSRNLGHERWLKIFFATPGPISTRQT